MNATNVGRVGQRSSGHIGGHLIALDWVLGQRLRILLLLTAQALEADTGLDLAQSISQRWFVRLWKVRPVRLKVDLFWFAFFRRSALGSTNLEACNGCDSARRRTNGGWSRRQRSMACRFQFDPNFAKIACVCFWQRQLFRTYRQINEARIIMMIVMAVLRPIIARFIESDCFLNRLRSQLFATTLLPRSIGGHLFYDLRNVVHQNRFRDGQIERCVWNRYSSDQRINSSNRTVRYLVRQMDPIQRFRRLLRVDWSASYDSN